MALQGNNIESSVTKLLVETKRLLETLTAWSKSQASDEDVSNVYVRLGNEFNVSQQAFVRAGIDMQYEVDKTRILISAQGSRVCTR